MGKETLMAAWRGEVRKGGYFLTGGSVVQVTFECRDSELKMPVEFLIKKCYTVHLCQIRSKCCYLVDLNCPATQVAEFGMGNILAAILL